MYQVNYLSYFYRPCVVKTHRKTKVIAANTKFVTALNLFLRYEAKNTVVSCYHCFYLCRFSYNIFTFFRTVFNRNWILNRNILSKFFFRCLLYAYYLLSNILCFKGRKLAFAVRNFERLTKARATISYKLRKLF